MALEYFHISIHESGMHYLYNDAGAGFSGATWACLQKALKLRGINTHGDLKRWVKSHPGEANRAIAAYFGVYMADRPIWKWHNNGDPKKNIWYDKRVRLIADTCNKT